MGTENIAVPLEEEKRLVFEIVESNSENISAVPPDDAVLASDKNTRASDLNPESATGRQFSLYRRIRRNKRTACTSCESGEKFSSTRFRTSKRF